MQDLQIATQSWQEIFKESFKNSDELLNFLGKEPIRQPFSTFIPRPLALKIKNQGEESALWKQFVPSLLENDLKGFFDPIGDQVHAKNHGIIHRYDNRLLFSPTTICPVHCRYCFRKNELNDHSPILKANTDKLIAYLIANPQVEEVILTGGDPLILSNDKLHELFDKILSVKTVKYLRLHSRTPIVIAERIDKGLIELLQYFETKFESLSLAIHVNHPTELDEHVCSYLKLLSQTNCQLLSQTVLLKHVNDQADVLITLFKKLNQLKIRPYYLHHPDQVLGAMHFYLSLEEGRKIYLNFKNKLPGWMVPHYVVDSPLGAGKTLAYNSESLTFSGQLIDKNGHLVSHPNP
jgi:lysine 2,3-aminomutase